MKVRVWDESMRVGGACAEVGLCGSCAFRTVRV